MIDGSHRIGGNINSSNISLLETQPNLRSPNYDNEKSVNLERRRSSRRSAVFHIIIYPLATWGFISIWLQIFQSVFPVSTTNEPLSTFPSILLDVYYPETLPSGMTLCDCGSNTQEAISRSCVYDTLATAWLPPFCRDTELTAQFDKSGDGPNGSWSYFSDSEGRHQLSVGELGSLGDGDKRFWASRRWHRAHCLFYWQKLYRMRKTGLVLEERYHSWSHIQHCTRLLMNEDVDLDILVDVPVALNSSLL